MLSYLQLPDLSQEERAALRSYKSAEDTETLQSKCFDLNRELRNGVRDDELEEELGGVVAALDSVFARCPKLREDTTVFRGVGERMYFPLFPVGQRFRTMEFWSTTLDESATEPFLKHEREPGYGVVFEISLPTGFPAYNMETLEGFGGHEAELLLPRRVLWKVISVERRDPNKFLERYFENIAHATIQPVNWC